MTDILRTGDVKRILICRTDSLGDVILTLPLIAETKRKFSDSKLSFLVSNYVRELIENYEGIDEIILIEDFNNYKSALRFIKSQNFDLVINVYPRFKLAFLFYMAGIKYRIGTAYRWYSFLFNKQVHEHRKYAEKHESDYNLNLLKAITKEISYQKKFNFRYSDAEKEEVEHKLNGFNLSLHESFVIVHAGSKGSAKDWSVENFITYSNLFLEHFNKIKIVYTGLEEESSLIKTITNNIQKVYKDQIVNLTGKTNLRELLILMDNTVLLISNGTGPIHLAGALNKNIIGFYPNEVPINDVRWKPLSDNAVILKPEKVKDSMDTIKVMDVMKETQKILELKN